MVEDVALRKLSALSTRHAEVSAKPLRRDRGLARHLGQHRGELPAVEWLD